MDLSEEQLLLERIRASDYHAFEEMHHRHYHDLLILALKKLGDKDEAYDLVQDMFMELWEKRDAFFLSNPLQNYLKNRLWFKLSDYFRKKGFREKHLAAFSEYFEQDNPAAADPMEAEELELQYQELIARINRSVEKMPDKMREIFTLSREGEYGVPEIAGKLGISTKTVYNQVNMAVERIRRDLADIPLTGLQLAFLIWLTNN